MFQDIREWDMVQEKEGTVDLLMKLKDLIFVHFHHVKKIMGNLSNLFINSINRSEGSLT